MKKKKRHHELFLYGILFASLIIIDQFTKDLFYRTRASYDAGIFILHVVTNAGASFGILKQYNAILLFLSIIVLAALILYFRKAEGAARLFIVLIAAGTAGNLLSRMSYGFVIDFIDFRFFPVFNVADSLICIGVVGLGIILLKEGRKQKRRHT